MKWTRIADARLAVWGDEAVLYHIQSGNSYWFQGAWVAQLLAICVAQQTIDERDLLKQLDQSVSEAAFSAFIQQLLSIHLIAEGE